MTETNKLEVEEKKEWKIKRYCLIILIKFIAVEWHQSSFAARTGFQKWGAVGFDCRGIQATVLVYEKPKHGADKGTNFR